MQNHVFYNLCALLNRDYINIIHLICILQVRATGRNGAAGRNARRRADQATNAGGGPVRPAACRVVLAKFETATLARVLVRFRNFCSCDFSSLLGMYKHEVVVP